MNTSAYVLAAMIGPFINAVPQPSASATPAPTLREIGHVRATVLCTTLRQGVVPAVVGLDRDDELIGASHRAFAKMSRDVSESSTGGMGMDKQYLGQVQTRLERNLKALDTLLADHARFPDDPTGAATGSSMKSQVQAVADEQKKTLDLLSGVLATEALGEMQQLPNNINELSGNLTTPQPIGRATDTPVSFLGTAGLPENLPDPNLPTFNSKLSTLEHHTIYDTLLSGLEEHQATIAVHEHALTTTIVAAVNECRSSLGPQATPEPSGASSPAPSPSP